VNVAGGGDANPVVAHGRHVGDSSWHCRGSGRSCGTRTSTLSERR
jgi:hypothetical protein